MQQGRRRRTRWREWSVRSSITPVPQHLVLMQQGTTHKSHFYRAWRSTALTSSRKPIHNVNLNITMTDTLIPSSSSVTEDDAPHNLRRKNVRTTTRSSLQLVLPMDAEHRAAMQAPSYLVISRPRAWSLQLLLQNCKEYNWLIIGHGRVNDPSLSWFCIHNWPLKQARKEQN